MTLKEQAEKLGIKVDGRWNDARIQQEIEAKMPQEAEEVEEETVSTNKFETVEWANERAKLIWGGQSTALSIVERTGRIKRALRDKGFTQFDKMELPHPECKKYI